jgi:hypothetical protein
MNVRTHSLRSRAVRPVLEGLETRELLSLAPVHPAEVHSLRARPSRVPVIAQLPTAPERTASTVPANGDVNPYGVVFIPPNFARGGVLSPGDVLVSNFNNSSNLQGTGTTIVRVTPGNQTSVFFQGPPGIGLSTALGVLSRGFVVVGNSPSTDGTSATAKPGSLIVLDKNGTVVGNFADSTFLNGPWDLTINDRGSRAQIFVSNVLSGTITRIDVKFPPKGGFQVLGATQIASGYTHRGDPAAFEIGPTGLVYTPKTDTLYVASTGDNAIYAIRGAGKAKSDQGTGTIVYQDATHLHGPLGLAMAADGNLIASQGDAINPDPNQPSELVEFTPKGKFVGQLSLNPTQGGAFGVASSATSQHEFAAVNDINNTVMVWTVKA